MKKIISLWVILTAFGASAQVDSVLFGIATTVSGSSMNPTTSLYLTRANTSTGVLTNAGSSITTGPIQVGNSTIDSYNKVFYFMSMMNGSNALLGVDLYNGSLVSSQTITLAHPGNIHNMYFNCGDTTIYALSTNPSSSSVYLARVNPATGVVTDISANSISNSLQLNNVTIDPYNQIYYYFTLDSIVGVSLNSGAVVSKGAFSLSSSTLNFNYSGIFYNRADSILYGLALSPPTMSLNPSSGSIYLAEFAPNGVVSIISPTSVASMMQVAHASIDPYQNMYQFVNGNNQLLSISLQSGLTVSSPTITNAAGGLFYEMNYNCNLCPSPKPNVVSGISKHAALEEIKVYPNPASHTLFVEMKTPGNYRVEITDVSGRLMLSLNEPQTNRVKIDLTRFEKGMYFIDVYTSNQKAESKSFVVIE